MQKISIKNNIKAIISCLLWATAFVGIKIGLKYSKPISFAGIRFMFSGILLMLFVKSHKEYFLEIKKNIKLILLLSLVQTFFAYFLFYKGISMVDGALAAIIIGSSPLISAIAAHYFMESDKMSFVKVFSLLIGIIGITIIAVSRKPWGKTGLVELWGVILLILTTISGSIGNIIVARNRDKVKPLIFSSAQLFIGGLWLFMVSFPLEGIPKIIYHKEYYFAVIWLAILSAVAISVWYSLLNNHEIKVSELNLWKFIIPVFGAIFSWIILPDEHPKFYPIVGMFFVGLSIVMYNYFGLKEKIDLSAKQ